MKLEFFTVRKNTVSQEKILISVFFSEFLTKIFGYRNKEEDLLDFVIILA